MRDFSDWRFHRDDWRPDRTQCHAPRRSRAKEIEANTETYKAQVFKILDPEKTEVRYNSEWLGRMGYQDIVRLCAHYTIARLLERDDFAKRYKDGVPISMHELLYPLAQGFDSVNLECDVEMGGTDQKFNLQVETGTAERLWTAWSDRGDHAASRRPGRRKEDVEVAGKLHRHHRTAGRYVP